MLQFSEGNLLLLRACVYNIDYRVEGLINQGVFSYDDRPLWFDVYKAFPPRVEPVYNRPIPTEPVRNILYHEDAERA